MLLRLGALCSFVMLGPAGSALSQQTLADRLQPRFAAAPSGTEGWFAVGIELIEALLQCDIAAAVPIAEQMWSVAEASPLPGARLAIGALAELVVMRREGPLAAAGWRTLAGEPPRSCSARLRACFYLARARCLCMRGEHGEEAQHVAPGQAAAAELGDVLMRLRAGQMSLHLLPDRGHEWLRQLYEEGLAAPAAAEVATFEPWLLVDEHVGRFQAGQIDESIELLATAEAAAARDGNHRALALVQQYRGDHHFRQNEVARALELHQRAAASLDRLGDRPLQASNRVTCAFLSLRLGDLEAASASVADAEAMVESRGILGLERSILELRLELAVRQRDGEGAAAIVGELDAKAPEYSALEQRFMEAKAGLLRAEAQRAQAEKQLREASAQGLERVREQRTAVGAGIALALAVIALMAWRSRRRLLVANAALAEQVRQVEAAQAAKARLEERMRELERTERLGTMAAGVAHDFNNLLTGILGNAELLAEGGKDAETSAIAQGITMAGQQAARLCRQLQVYAGAAPLQAVPLDVAALARNLLPVLRASVRGAVDFTVISEQDSPGVLGDRAQIEQVLLNLAVNARDAKARSLRILIAAGAGADSGMTRIEVTDDGEGMPPAVAQRVFDPFFTTRFPGRGLGLAVVHGVARRHGGSVTVSSAPGRGTTFTLLLPGAASPERSTEPVVELPAMAPSMSGMSVFLVDDDAAVLRMLALMLRQLGCPSTAFGDGASLLAALAAAPPDGGLVLFVDLAMPQMDGCEVMRRARECRPDVRLVLMSGHDQAYVEQVAGELRPDHVLTKPFALASLRAALAAASSARHGSVAST